jgi:hypothetical protein
MPFLFRIERRFYSDSLEKRLAREADFLKAHGGWGPRLTYQIFEAVSDLATGAGTLVEMRGRRQPRHHSEGRH